MITRIFAILLLTITLLPTTGRCADLDAMIGQMIMAGFRGYAVDDSSPIVRDIKERHLGGVVLFDYDVALGKPERNIKSPKQVKQLIASLQSQASTPLLVGVDQEGGKVQRLKARYGFTETPSAQSLGNKSDEAIRKAAQTMGAQLHALGFNLNFAPVADINVDSNSPAIGKLERSFSIDPRTVSRCDQIFLEELAKNSVLGCLKHFPGHGSAGTDSHLGLTDVTETWTAEELIPYYDLAHKAKIIMTAHIFNARLDSEYPATLSHKAISALLRDQIGYEGVVITDDMNMKAITAHYGQEEAIRLAIMAGADILLFGNNLNYDPNIVRTAHATIKRLVTSGTIPSERIEESYDRIMKLKESIR